MPLRTSSQGRATVASGFPGPRERPDRFAPTAAPTNEDVERRPTETGVVLLRSRPEALPSDRSVVGPEPHPSTLWCVDGRVARGTDAYLVMPGPAARLVARGQVVRGSFLGPRWDRVGTVGLHIAVEWAQVLDPADGLPFERLAAEIANDPGEDANASGWELPARFRKLLARDWEAWYAAHQHRGRRGRPRHRAHRAHRVPRLPEWTHRPPLLLPLGLIQVRAAVRDSIQVSAARSP